ncbi:MAG TPA: hypothetical protein VKE74_18390 [Gemmataceae bacterium]|nr:hypothetical protein [Gemmataceae bacterium]
MPPSYPETGSHDPDRSLVGNTGFASHLEADTPNSAGVVPW